jgi:hypothetical protein
MHQAERVQQLLQLRLQALVTTAGQGVQKWLVQEMQHTHHLILLLRAGAVLQQQQVLVQQLVEGL